MLDLFEDKDRTYLDIIITRYVRALSQTEHLCNAIQTRRSINNIFGSKINVNNIQEALNAIDTNDTSQWVIHDPSRLGGHIRSLLNIPDDSFNFLINLIKPSEIIKIEAAFFEALCEIVYISHSDDITTMRSYDFHLVCCNDGKLEYNIQSPTQFFNGEINIPVEKYDIEKLNSDNAYINTILPDILGRIAEVNPSHVDELISNGIMQQYTAMFWSQDFDQDELVIQKNIFVEKATDEILKHIVRYLDILLSPAFIEFKKFLNPETIQIYEQYESNPIEKMNAYLDLMYKRQQMLQQIPIMQSELPPSSEEQHSIDNLLYDELELMHHSLYEQLLLQHPNLDEIKENIAILMKQIANYSKINLTQDHQWFTQFNAFEKEIDKAFTPATFVQIYEQIQVACSNMCVTLMTLESTYKSVWNELIQLTQDYQLPLLQTAYISPEDLLNLKPIDYHLRINNMRAIISSLQDDTHALSKCELLSTFIDTQALIEKYRTIAINELENLTDEQILDLSPRIYHEKLEYFKTQQTIETKLPSHLFDAFFNFFQRELANPVFLEIKVSEEELNYLKTICKGPYEQFLQSKADKIIKPEKRQIAHEAIHDIQQSTKPSEIKNVIERSIENAENAKVSWFGIKTGDLMKASLRAMSLFEKEIEKIENKVALGHKKS